MFATKLLFGAFLIEIGWASPGTNTPPVIVLQRNWKIPEDEIVGSRIERVRAQDVEKDRLAYGLKPGVFLDGSGYFRVDPGTGDIYLNRSLVGQAGAQYYLFVTAYDGEFESKMEVFVEVMLPDGHTQPPQLPPAFTTPLPVSVPPALLPNLYKPKDDLSNIFRTSRPPGPYPYFIVPAHPGPDKEPPLERRPSRPDVTEDGRSAGAELTLTVVPVLAALGLVPLLGLGIWLAARTCRQRHPISTQISGEGEKKVDSLPGGTITGDILQTPCTSPAVTHNIKGPLSRAGKYQALGWGDQRKWEFPRNQLRMLVVVGEGCFGEVWRCEAWNIAGLPGSTVVAVKTLKDNAGKRETQDLVSELEVLKSLDPHPNVVQLLGACTEQDPLYLIMEFVALGKLQAYLRNSRAEHDYRNLHGRSGSLTSRDLMAFTYQVARAMDYLSSRGIIHRDLAARNVLVGEDKTCKVADFGFARDIITSHVYERKSEGRLPIRWMACESLYDNIFSAKTDVWSFGILMWEIVTLGSTPYPGMAAGEVMQRVRDGYRLEKPEHCKREMYNIMYYCWAHDAAERPEFSELSRVLEQLLESDTDYIELDRFPEHMYYNMTPCNISTEQL